MATPYKFCTSFWQVSDKFDGCWFSKSQSHRPKIVKCQDVMHHALHQTCQKPVKNLYETYAGGHGWVRQSVIPGKQLDVVQWGNVIIITESCHLSNNLTTYYSLRYFEDYFQIYFLSFQLSIERTLEALYIKLLKPALTVALKVVWIRHVCVV